MNIKRFGEGSLETVFGRNLKKKREAMGLSQSQVGAKIGVSKYRISELERARFSPSLHIIQVVSDALNLDPLELLRS